MLQSDVRGEPAGLPRPVRQGADRRGRGEVLPDPQPRLAGRLQVHVAGQPGDPRREPARPLRADRQPRPRRPRSRRNETALQGLVTNLRITTGSFAAQDVALEQAIAELPNTLDAGQTRLRQPQRVLPADPRLLSRGAARASGRRRRRSTAATPLLRQLASAVAARPSSADWSPTCARGPRPGQADPRDDPVPEADAGAVELLQQHDPALGERPDQQHERRLQLPARLQGQGLRGDRLRARRDRRREPLRRRERPVHPRDRRRRHQHRAERRRVDTGETLAGVTPFPIDGSMPRLRPEDAVQAEEALREPGPAEPGALRTAAPPQQPRAPRRRSEPGDSAAVVEDSQAVLKDLAAAALGR